MRWLRDWAALPLTGAQIRALAPENVVVTDATHLHIEAEFDDAGQTALLQQLVNGGAQVFSFCETRQTLAAGYEQSITDTEDGSD